MRLKEKVCLSTTELVQKKMNPVYSFLYCVLGAYHLVSGGEDAENIGEEAHLLGFNILKLTDKGRLNYI